MLLVLKIMITLTPMGGTLAPEPIPNTVRVIHFVFPMFCCSNVDKHFIKLRFYIKVHCFTSAILISKQKIDDRTTLFSGNEFFTEAEG